MLKKKHYCRDCLWVGYVKYIVGCHQINDGIPHILGLSEDGLLTANIKLCILVSCCSSPYKKWSRMFYLADFFIQVYVTCLNKGKEKH